MPQIKSTTYFEIINLSKLKHIINNPKLYKDRIDKENEDMRRFHKNKSNTFNMLKKLLSVCKVPSIYEGTEFGVIQVSYNKGKKSNDEGRWYCKDGIGLQPLISCVRHSICEGLWTDIDQVNSHPTILKILFDKCNLKSPMLDECVNDRDNFLKKINKDRNKAKTQVIAVINGGNFGKNPVLKKFDDELKENIDIIITKPEYQKTFDYITKEYPDADNIRGKVISRILQNKENELLEAYLDWVNMNDLGGVNNIALIFDGFQLLSKFNITDDMLNQCRKYAFEQTGYDIELKIKPFENGFELPDDYADFDILPELVQRFISKLDYTDTQLFEKIRFIEIYEATHLKIAELGALIFQDWTYFDENAKKWFYCNLNNIWCSTDNSGILRYLIQKVLGAIFDKSLINTFDELDKLDEEEEKLETPKIPKKTKKRSGDEANEKETEETEETEADTKKKEEDKKKLAEIQEKKERRNQNLKHINKIRKELQNSTYMSGVMNSISTIYNKKGFYEECIDSKEHLFAFKNKVYDFNKCELRNIKPDDYIMTNTEYDYPDNVNEDDIVFINNFMETILPDEEMRNYVLDTTCSMLNGKKKEQYFLVFTGGGANGKTTYMKLISSILGKYYCSVAPETFTKPKKTANDTGELYKAKGVRNVSANEPNEGDKLQAPIIKPLVEADAFVKARGLYENAVEFPIQFVITICCNNKPELSSVDGGIARRLRIVDWKRRFLEPDNPQYDPTNHNHLPCDVNMVGKMSSKNIKEAFIRMMLDRWENRVSKFNNIPVPAEVVEASNSFVDDSNPVAGFIRQNYKITRKVTDEVQSSSLYDAFVSYCGRNCGISNKRFKDDMMGITGIGWKKGKRYNVYTGLEAYPDEDE
jgi:P4 family phage/plasmid primase-like protien